MYLYLFMYVCMYILECIFVLVGFIQIKSIHIADYYCNLDAPVLQDLYTP